MNRYNEFVFKSENKKFWARAEQGKSFQFSEGSSGELIVQTVLDDYEDYKNPPIPEGYKHVVGTWNSGFVIERLLDGSRFTWIPVNYLSPNGTLDGETFNEKLGRRNYDNKIFSNGAFHEEVSCERILQIRSIKKYGGFYISSFKFPNKLCSAKGEQPWGDACYHVASPKARKFEQKSEMLLSHLPFGFEFDSMVEWLKQGTTVEDEYGLSINHIYDLNGSEWTQEEFGLYENVYRSFAFDEADIIARRGSECPVYSSPNLGFRVALYIA